MYKYAISLCAFVLVLHNVQASTRDGTSWRRDAHWATSLLGYSPNPLSIDLIYGDVTRNPTIINAAVRLPSQCLGDRASARAAAGQWAVDPAFLADMNGYAAWKRAEVALEGILPPEQRPDSATLRGWVQEIWAAGRTDLRTWEGDAFNAFITQYVADKRAAAVVVPAPPLPVVEPPVQPAGRRLLRAGHGPAGDGAAVAEPPIGAGGYPDRDDRHALEKPATPRVPTRYDMVSIIAKRTEAVKGWVRLKIQQAQRQGAHGSGSLPANLASILDAIGEASRSITDAAVHFFVVAHHPLADLLARGADLVAINISDGRDAYLARGAELFAINISADRAAYAEDAAPESQHQARTLLARREQAIRSLYEKFRVTRESAGEILQEANITAVLTRAMFAWDLYPPAIEDIIRSHSWGNLIHDPRVFDPGFSGGGAKGTASGFDKDSKGGGMDEKGSAAAAGSAAMQDTWDAAGYWRVSALVDLLGRLTVRVPEVAAVEMIQAVAEAHGWTIGDIGRAVHTHNKPQHIHSLMHNPRGIFVPKADQPGTKSGIYPLHTETLEAVNRLEILMGWITHSPDAGGIPFAAIDALQDAVLQARHLNVHSLRHILEGTTLDVFRVSYQQQLRSEAGSGAGQSSKIVTGMAVAHSLEEETAALIAAGLLSHHSASAYGLAVHPIGLPSAPPREATEEDPSPIAPTMGRMYPPAEEDKR